MEKRISIILVVSVLLLVLVGSAYAVGFFDRFSGKITSPFSPTPERNGYLKVWFECYDGYNLMKQDTDCKSEAIWVSEILRACRGRSGTKCGVAHFSFSNQCGDGDYWRNYEYNCQGGDTQTIHDGRCRSSTAWGILSAGACKTQCLTKRGINSFTFFNICTIE